jgi:peroxiredoxin
MFADTTYETCVIGPPPLERASFFVPGVLSGVLPRTARFGSLLHGLPLLLLSLALLGVLAGCGGGDAGSDANQTEAAESTGETGADTASRTAADPSSRAANESKRLETRMVFPAVTVLTLDGEETNTRALLRAKDSLVIFIEIGCEACEDVMAVWKELADTVPPGLNVIAVAQDEPAYVADYAKQTGFPFPLYCDEAGAFGSEYHVGVFPTMVGVPADGRIAYIGKPVTPEFKPVDAWKMLMDVKEKREKAGI